MYQKLPERILHAGASARRIHDPAARSIEVAPACRALLVSRIGILHINVQRRRLRRAKRTACPEYRRPSSAWCRRCEPRREFRRPLAIRTQCFLRSECVLGKLQHRVTIRCDNDKASPCGSRAEPDSPLRLVLRGICPPSGPVVSPFMRRCISSTDISSFTVDISTYSQTDRPKLPSRRP